MSLARLRLVAGLAVAAAAAAFAACSIALDPPLEPGGADAGFDGLLVDAASDGGADGDDSAPPTRCTQDVQCKSDNACVVGRCDVPTGRCAYDLCPTEAGACAVERCDLESNACTDPTTLAFAVKQFKVPTPKSFGASKCVNAARCAALRHPYLFVSLDDTVLAYGIGDLHPAAQPRVLAVDGLQIADEGGTRTLKPTSVVASGSRVFFVGEPGASTNTTLPVAWVDVPDDPFATSFIAKVGSVPIQKNSTNTAFAAPNGDLLIVSVPAVGQRTMLRVSVPPGASVPTTNAADRLRAVATAGDRLVLADVDAGGVVMSVEAMPTATGAPTYAVLGAGGAGSVLPATQAYATDDDGRLLVATAAGDDAGARRVRLVRAIGAPGVRQIEDGPSMDLASFAAPVSAARATGPVAWVAPDLAIAATLTPDDSTQTSLTATLVHTSDAGLSLDAKNLVLPALDAGVLYPNVSAMFVAKGIVYWVWQRNTDTTVSVLAPSCP